MTPAAKTPCELDPEKAVGLTKVNGWPRYRLRRSAKECPEMNQQRFKPGGTA